MRKQLITKTGDRDVNCRSLVHYSTNCTTATVLIRTMRGDTGVPNKFPIQQNFEINFSETSKLIVERGSYLESQ